MIESHNDRVLLIGFTMGSPCNGLQHVVLQALECAVLLHGREGLIQQGDHVFVFLVDIREQGGGGDNKSGDDALQVLIVGILGLQLIEGGFPHNTWPRKKGRYSCVRKHPEGLLRRVQANHVTFGKICQQRQCLHAPAHIRDNEIAIMAYSNKIIEIADLRQLLLVQKNDMTGRIDGRGQPDEIFISRSSQAGDPCRQPGHGSLVRFFETSLFREFHDATGDAGTYAHLFKHLNHIACTHGFVVRSGKYQLIIVPGWVLDGCGTSGKTRCDRQYAEETETYTGDPGKILKTELLNCLCDIATYDLYDIFHPFSYDLSSTMGVVPINIDRRDVANIPWISKMFSLVVYTFSIMNHLFFISTVAQCEEGTPCFFELLPAKGVF